MPVILLAIFIDLVGFGMILPILPFLTLTYGGDSLTGTALMSIYAFTAFTIGPLWGKLSDRIGRKPTLAITFFGAATAYLMLALSSTLLMVFVARAISGAMSGNVGIVMAAMADMTDDNNRGKAMGMIGAAFGLGFAFGPGIGGYLSTLGSETSVFLPGMAACALSLLAMALTAVYVPETNPKKDKTTDEKLETPHHISGSGLPAETRRKKPQWLEIITAPGRAPLFIMFVIASVAQSISFSITPFWVEVLLNWSAKEVGFLLMSVGVFVFVMQLWAVGPMFRRFGEIKSLNYCAAVHILGCLVIIIGPPTLTTAIIGFPLVLGALSMSYPALNSLISQRTAKTEQGAALGLSNGFAALGRVAGPIAAGATFSAATPDIPFFIVIAIGVGVLAWTWSEERRAPYTRSAEPPVQPPI